MQEMREFKQLVDSYRPQMSNLDLTSSKCCVPPPTPGGPKTTKLVPAVTESTNKVTTALQSVWERYNGLDVVVKERSEVLEGFLPNVQQYESLQGAWGQNLEKWEDRVSHLPPPSTKPALIEEQIREIKVHIHVQYTVAQCTAHISGKHTCMYVVHVQ